MLVSTTVNEGTSSAPAVKKALKPDLETHDDGSKGERRSGKKTKRVSTKKSMEAELRTLVVSFPPTSIWEPLINSETKSLKLVVNETVGKIDDVVLRSKVPAFEVRENVSIFGPAETLNIEGGEFICSMSVV